LSGISMSRGCESAGFARKPDDKRHQLACVRVDRTKM
jgi:hypothetical protein